MSGTPFFRFLTTNGLASGDRGMNVDGSVTQQRFKLLPDPALGNGQTLLEVSRCIFFIEDNGAFRADRFGAIASGLTNGCDLGIYGADDVEVNDITSGEPIKLNAGFARYCHDVNFFTIGTGDDFLTARWTFTQTGLPLTIKGGSYLGFNINDDLSSIVNMTVMAQGLAYE